MPLAIIIMALVLIIAGIRGSYKDLAGELVKDFTGQGNFLNWLAAIALVGAVGYVPKLQHWSRMFIALIIIAIFLKNGDGLIDQLAQAIDSVSADAAHPNPVGAQTTADGSNAGPSDPMTGNASSIYSGVTGGGIGGLPPDLTKLGGASTTKPSPSIVGTMGAGIPDFIPGL